MRLAICLTLVFAFTMEWQATTGQELIEHAVKAGPEAMDILNAQRARKGLPPYIKDDGLTETARRRVEFNKRRGNWGHYLRNGSPRFRDLDGKMVGYGGADGEGCGYSQSRNRVSACYTLEREVKTAGVAGVQADNGAWYWVILVRHNNGKTGKNRFR